MFFFPAPYRNLWEQMCKVYTTAEPQGCLGPTGQSDPNPAPHPCLPWL